MRFLTSFLTCRVICFSLSMSIFYFRIFSYLYIFSESPFEGRYVPETAASYFNHGVIRSSQLPETITNHTLQFIQKCIQLDPEARFASFTELLTNLERATSSKK